MKKALLVSVLMGFGLFGCINDNPAGEHRAATGIARIKLPQLPEGYVADGPGSEYSLTVTVTGAGMQPLSRAWSLSGSGGRIVSFEDIPAGPGRIFTGMIMRGTVKTHEGTYASDIGVGESVYVPLVLRDVGNGRAEICVEVEGWPGSPHCAPIDTLPAVTSALAGCWHIEAYAGAVLISGQLSLNRDYEGLYGAFQFDDGSVVRANANFTDGAWRVTFAPDTSANRSYQFRIDSFSFGPADQPNGLFWGVMMDSSFQKVLGKVTGTAGQCLIAVELNDTFKTDRGIVVGAPDPLPYYPPQDSASKAH